MSDRFGELQYACYHTVELLQMLACCASAMYHLTHLVHTISAAVATAKAITSNVIRSERGTTIDTVLSKCGKVAGCCCPLVEFNVGSFEFGGCAEVLE